MRRLTMLRVSVDVNLGQFSDQLLSLSSFRIEIRVKSTGKPQQISNIVIAKVFLFVFEI